MMVWINLGEKPEKAKWFRERHHLTSPVLMADDETPDPRLNSRFTRRYNYHYSVVVDPHMIVRYTGASWWQGNDLQRTVKEVLAEPARDKSTASITASKKPNSL